MMKKSILTIIGLSAAAFTYGQTIIGYWDQNSNNLPGGGFGFLSTAFPQAATIGSATLSVGGGIFSETNTNATGDTIFTFVPSFGGSTVNAYMGAASGGSLSLQGGTDTNNNGGYVQFAFSMSGQQDLEVTYATRRTNSGFNTQTWSWSLDGVSFTDFQTVDVPTSFEAIALSSLSTLNDSANAYLRVTVDGATGATGNNRFDNILITATPVPEPGTYAAVLGLLALGAVYLRRRKA